MLYCCSICLIRPGRTSLSPPILSKFCLYFYPASLPFNTPAKTSTVLDGHPFPTYLFLHWSKTILEGKPLIHCNLIITFYHLQYCCSICLIRPGRTSLPPPILSKFCLYFYPASLPFNTQAKTVEGFISFGQHTVVYRRLRYVTVAFVGPTRPSHGTPTHIHHLP